MEKDIKNIIIKVDKELHRKFKIACAKKGVTQKDVIISYMLKEIEKNY